MTNCQIFYTLALLVCVGGWVGIFTYMCIPPNDKSKKRGDTK